MEEVFEKPRLEEEPAKAFETDGTLVGAAFRRRGSCAQAFFKRFSFILAWWSSSQPRFSKKRKQWGCQYGKSCRSVNTNTVFHDEIRRPHSAYTGDALEELWAVPQPIGTLLTMLLKLSKPYPFVWLWCFVTNIALSLCYCYNAENIIRGFSGVIYEVWKSCGDGNSLKVITDKDMSQYQKHSVRWLGIALAAKAPKFAFRHMQVAAANGKRS